MANAAQSRQTLYSLQVMRAVAAFMVALYHAHLLLTEKHVAPAFENEAYFFAFGRSGVHLFFVLSGFIMVMTTREKGYSFREFIARRFRRIYPIYWVSALLCLAAFATLADPLSLSLTQAIGAMLLLPANAPRIIGAAWTLSFEIYFYICFGLAMMLGLTRGLLVLAAFFVGCVVAGALVRDQGPSLNQVTSVLLIEFMGGTAIGWLAVRGKLPPFGPWITGSALALFLAVLAVGYDRTNEAVSFGAPSLLLVLGLVSWEVRSGASGMVERIGRLGDSSYALYLNHEAVIYALVMLVPVRAFSSAGIVPASLAVALVCVMFGVGAHLFIEKPMLRLLTPKSRNLTPAPA